MVYGGNTFRDAQVAELIAEAQRRGAEQVLMEIANMPNRGYTPGFYLEHRYMCAWCLGTMSDHKPECLWPRALAVVTPEGER